MTHRGEIVEKIVRRSGHSLTKLAQELGISRNTLYNKFTESNLSYRFIEEVGEVILYDFSTAFPEMKEKIGLMVKNVNLAEDDQLADLWKVEEKYAHLLDKHSKLLWLLVQAANENEWPRLRQGINEFLAQP